MWTGFEYDFVGVTDNGGPEHFSALVGLLGALSLLGARGVQAYVAVVSAVALGFTLLVTGPSIGVITLITTLLGAAYIRLLRFAWAPVRKILVVGAGIVGVVGLILVASRGVATRLAAVIGEYESVDARYVIWESAINAISGWGWIFGHGTFFWNQDSPWRSQSFDSIVAAGYPGFSHAHSSYLDLLLAFGVAGALMLVTLLALVVSLSVRSWRESDQWTNYALPLLVLFSLGVQAISQSNLVSRPAGWLLCGVLIGPLVFSRDTRGVAPRALWAPWGSNPRPTD